MRQTLAVKTPMAIAAVLVLSSSLSAAPLRINGSTTVNPPVAEAAEILRAEKKMTITVDVQGGSSGGISGVGDGSIDIGMSSKPLSPEDRAKYPAVKFIATPIGEDAVALVVSSDVYNGGVRSLTKEQARGIYEGRITNWRQVGGPNRRIVFFNKEPGRGTWEVFAKWLYGDPKHAPEVTHPEVGGNEEGRTKVISTRGAITQLSASWVMGDGRIKALALETDNGTAVEPTTGNIAAGRYPLSRPLFFVTNDVPNGQARIFIDFMLSPRGQELVKKHGYLSLADLARPAKAAGK